MIECIEHSKMKHQLTVVALRNSFDIFKDMRTTYFGDRMNLLYDQGHAMLNKIGTCCDGDIKDCKQKKEQAKKLNAGNLANGKSSMIFSSLITKSKKTYPPHNFNFLRGDQEFRIHGWERNHGFDQGRIYHADEKQRCHST